MSMSPVSSLSVVFFYNESSSFLHPVNCTSYMVTECVFLIKNKESFEFFVARLSEVLVSFAASIMLRTHFETKFRNKSYDSPSLSRDS